MRSARWAASIRRCDAASWRHHWPNRLWFSNYIFWCNDLIELFMELLASEHALSDDDYTMSELSRRARPTHASSAHNEIASIKVWN